MINDECIDVLRSKSQINRVGEGLASSPIQNEALWGTNCYRMFRFLKMQFCMDQVLEAGPPTKSLISARLKRFVSIRRKIERARSLGVTSKLSTIDDIIGLRIICARFCDAIDFSKKLKSHTASCEKNYVLTPQDTGYRSVHHIIKVEQENPTGNNQIMYFTFEVQIRTLYQHLWSIWSESYGEQAKENRAPAEIKQHLQELSSKISDWEQSHQEDTQGELIELTGEKNLALLNKHGGLNTSVHHFSASSWNDAVNYLFYIENNSNNESNALLLSGVGNLANLDNILRITHPAFFRKVVVPIDLDSNMGPIYPP